MKESLMDAERPGDTLEIYDPDTVVVDTTNLMFIPPPEVLEKLVFNSMRAVVAKLAKWGINHSALLLDKYFGLFFKDKPCDILTSCKNGKFYFSRPGIDLLGEIKKGSFQPSNKLPYNIPEENVPESPSHIEMYPGDTKEWVVEPTPEGLKAWEKHSVHLLGKRDEVMLQVKKIL